MNPEYWLTIELDVHCQDGLLHLTRSQPLPFVPCKGLVLRVGHRAIEIGPLERVVWDHHHQRFAARVEDVRCRDQPMAEVTPSYWRLGWELTPDQAALAQEVM